jgi:RND superfamily putative drug exporter
MILVFASFIYKGQLPIQQIGLGFAAAVFADAYIARTVLVPSAMHVLGRAGWWLPAWLGRRGGAGALGALGETCGTRGGG